MNTTSRAWCPECGRTQPIADQFTEDTGDSRRTVEVYAITVLECGHHISRQTGAYPSPLQQAKPTPAWSMPDPFLGEG